VPTQAMWTQQNYMKSRNELIHEVKRINTQVAVQAALDHSLDLMRLGPKDNMGVRNHVPALFLRLGQDQACYDFVKWWNTIGHDYRYNWDDDRLPHEKLRNEDVFEPVDFLNHIRSHGDGTARVDNCMVPSFSDISHLVAITLLKIRLLLDLQLLQRMKQASAPHVPKEILRSSIITNNLKMLEHRDHVQQIQKLEKQVKQLYDMVKRANKKLWWTMWEPEPLSTMLEANPLMFEMGDVGELQTKLQECYNA
jgi:hypothetical protein